MIQYSKELKQSLIARMLPPNNVSVPDLVQETGIPKDTLYTWRNKARRSDGPAQACPQGELSSEAKFNIVLETAVLNENERGEYCRRKGLFPQQIEGWRQTCAQAHALAASKAERQQMRHQSKQIHSLETELRRKDKALAEAAALLVLQKKVRTLWEDPEDERPTSRSAKW